MENANIDKGASATASVQVTTDTSQNIGYSAQIVSADKTNMSVRGTRVAHVAQDHTVSQPIVPREKTPSQKYSDMEVDYTASDLSSSVPSTPSTETTNTNTQSSSSGGNPVPKIMNQMDRLSMPPPSRAPSVGTSVSVRVFLLRLHLSA